MKAPVELGEPSIQTVEKVVESVGTLKAKEQAILITENEGRLVMGKNADGKRLDEGDYVQKGQLIAILENPSLIATTALGARKEELEKAQIDLDRALRQIKDGIIMDSELEPLRVALTTARYAHEAAVAQLDKLNIRTPVSGKIVKLEDIVDGDIVSAGTELGKVMNYQTILAVVDITNPDYPLVKVGQKVRVTNFAFEDQVFDGRVEMISPIADDQTRAFTAEISIDNADLQLRPGMFIQSHIIVERHENAIVVEPRIVITRNNRPVVFVVEDDKAVEREVRVGSEMRDGVELLNGINKDDEIITDGFETLRDGTPVRIIR
jgi:RND family efflux transporter MFP subunit